MIWVLICVGLLFLFTLTPLGRVALGLRENSHRLRFLGYGVHRISVLVFAISAMFSGVAGGLQAINNESINYVVFDAQVSAAVVLNSYIGGVTFFLGPALGAAVMTFFSYAVSDLTRSWMLYQGILFVLVMMFMPTGLTGLISWFAGSVRKHGVLRMTPILMYWLIASFLLTVGTVFLVEFLQQLFSQDYRSIASADIGKPWPAIRVFGYEWLPGAFISWFFPVFFISIGCFAVRFSRAALFKLIDLPSTEYVDKPSLVTGHT